VNLVKPNIRLRALVVDDDAHVANSVADLLREAGAHVVGIAGDGSAALSLVAQLRPDLMVLDLAMPIMDGLEVLGALDGDPDAVALMVIVFSSQTEVSVVERARALGARHVLHKPSQLMMLGDIVSELLRQRGAD